MWDFWRELGRKCIHLLSLVFILVYFLTTKFLGHKAGLLALSFMLVVMIELEFVRLELKAKLPILSWLWKWYRRKREQYNFGGEVFFLIGALICFAVFDLRVAVAAILMTTFGDLAAALVGTKYGRIWIPKLKNRSLEGIAAEFVVNLIIGFLFLRGTVGGNLWWLKGFFPSGEPIFSAIIIMSLAATTVETVLTKMDDNLLIPLFSGFSGHLIFLLLGISTI